MNVSLKGRVAVITGGSQGIGLACATAISAAGAHVVLVSRSADRLREAADSLPGRTAGRRRLSRPAPIRRRLSGPARERR